MSGSSSSSGGSGGGSGAARPLVPISPLMTLTTQDRVTVEVHPRINAMCPVRRDVQNQLLNFFDRLRAAELDPLKWTPKLEVDEDELREAKRAAGFTVLLSDSDDESSSDDEGRSLVCPSSSGPVVCVQPPSHGRQVPCLDSG